MIATCKRESSLDSSLEDETVNDIPALLEANPNIKKVAFTGKKSEALFKTHFSHLDIETFYLPSPSPAYAAMKFEDKVQAYKKVLGYS
jgi:hypoxanthine-DNA glycosylase